MRQLGVKRTPLTINVEKVCHGPFHSCGHLARLLDVNFSSISMQEHWTAKYSEH